MYPMGHQSLLISGVRWHVSCPHLGHPGAQPLEWHPPLLQLWTLHFRGLSPSSQQQRCQPLPLLLASCIWPCGANGWGRNWGICPSSSSEHWAPICISKASPLRPHWGITKTVPVKVWWGLGVYHGGGWYWSVGILVLPWFRLWYLWLGCSLCLDGWIGLDWL